MKFVYRLFFGTSFTFHFCRTILKHVAFLDFCFTNLRPLFLGLCAPDWNAWVKMNDWSPTYISFGKLLSEDFFVFEKWEWLWKFFLLLPDRSNWEYIFTMGTKRSGSCDVHFIQKSLQPR